jgi:chaperone modulatory protein CbpM
MSMQVTHAVWLNDTAVCSIEHLVEVSGLSLDDIRNLVEDGVMAPVDASNPGAGFHSVHVLTVRQARRLRDDFELDRNGLALALTLLRRIESLEQELHLAQSGHGFALPAAGDLDESKWRHE